MDNEFAVNWFDLAIVLIVLGSGAISLIRGFGREILSLINFVVAFLVARLFSPQMAGVLQEHINEPHLRAIVAYILLFGVCLFVGALVMHVFSMLIKFSGLELFDRVLGTIFGVARGLIIVLVFVGISHWGGFFSYNRHWQESTLVPMIQPLDIWSRGLVRQWLFKRNMDGLSDHLMWQLDSLRNEQELQNSAGDSHRFLQMLGPRR